MTSVGCPGAGSRRGARRLLGYALRQRVSLGGAAVLAAGVSAATALQPWPTKILVDHALGGASLPGPAAAALGVLALDPSPWLLVAAAAAASLLIFAVSAGLDLGLRRVWSVAGQRMIYDLSGDVFGCLVRLPLSFHRGRRTGDSLARITTDSWCVHGAAEILLLMPLQQVLIVVAVSVVAFRLDPGLTGISLAVAPVLGVSAAVFGRSLKRRARDDREARSRLLAFVHETLDAIPVVQAFGAETRNRRRFGDLAEDAVVVSQRAKVLTSGYGVVTGLATTLGTATVLYAGGLRVLAGTLSVGSLLVFLAYLRSLQNAFRMLAEGYGRLRSVEASADRVLEILEAGDDVPESSAARRASPAPAAGSHIRFENVGFGYEPGRAVLSNVTLEVESGETLALVGPSGAGKTTLVSLVPRLFDPWQGSVSVDGEDVRTLALDSLRQKVALVLQEPFLLPVSVAENIAYGRPDATLAQIEEAARCANADAFIRELPDGYATVLGERGATLSGGEQQRLAIARALLVDAPILVLDEPTSALDAQTEKLLLDAVDRLSLGRTTLCIAHRLSTVERADRIAVLQGGRVVELGTHFELLAAGGLYARLHALGRSRDRAVA